MVRINDESFWLFVPALTNLFIGSEALERVEALSNVISQQEGLQVSVQVLAGLAVIFLHGGFFEGAVQAFHWPIGPRMVGFGEPRVDAKCLAHTRKDMLEGVWIALAGSELEAVISEHGVALRGYGGAQVAQELSGDGLGGVRL
jgi:hypothetical protein